MQQDGGTSSDRIACQGCGKDNPASSRYCIYCGNELRSDRGKAADSAKTPRDSVSDTKRRIKTLSIIVILAIVGLVLLAGTLGGGIGKGTTFQNAATVSFTISNASSSTIGVDIYWNGNQIGSTTLGPGQVYQNSVSVSFSGSSATGTISASGGGNSDSQSYIVYPGQTSSVSLTL